MRHTKKKKKQECVTYTEEKEQSIETIPVRAQMLDLARPQSSYYK